MKPHENWRSYTKFSDMFLLLNISLYKLTALSSPVTRRPYVQLVHYASVHTAGGTHISKELFLIASH